MGRLAENQINSHPLQTLTATCTEYTTLQRSVIVFSITSVQEFQNTQQSLPYAAIADWFCN